MLGSNAADPETIARAREIYERGGADADVQAAAISVVASNGTADDFDEFVARAAQTANPQEQLRYLYSLGDFPTEELVLRAAELALSDEIRAQNGPFVIQRALRNREHGAGGVGVRARQLGPGAAAASVRRCIPRVIEGTTWLVDDAVADDVTTFVDTHPLASGGRTVAQHMERLRVHRATVARERDRFSAALLQSNDL